MKLEWQDRLIPNPNGNPTPINSSITDNEAALLGLLAERGNVLEVGTAYGYSTILMAQAARRVTAVDPHAWLPSWEPLRHNLHTYGVEARVEVWRYGAETALPSLARMRRQFDLIFIDGDHQTAAVDRDVRLALPLLVPGVGVLACHDWDEDTCPGVRAALEPLLGLPAQLVDTLAVYRGLGGQ